MYTANQWVLLLVVFRHNLSIIRFLKDFFLDIFERFRQTSYEITNKQFKMKKKKEWYRTSLVAQWLRICLPMQGTWV